MTNSREVTLRARASIFHWSEMKTYQTALSGKYSLLEFSSTPREKNICVLGKKETRLSRTVFT